MVPCPGGLPGEHAECPGVTCKHCLGSMCGESRNFLQLPLIGPYITKGPVKFCRCGHLHHQPLGLYILSGPTRSRLRQRTAEESLLPIASPHVTDSNNFNPSSTGIVSATRPSIYIHSSHSFIYSFSTFIEHVLGVITPQRVKSQPS